MTDETPTNEQGIPLEALGQLPEPGEMLRISMEATPVPTAEISLKEVEVSKLNLKQNDVLVVKMQGMDLDHDLIKSLQKHFQKVFPNNKVLVFSLTEDATMDLEIIQAALLTEQSSCATAPKGYCEGCDCGKKEAAEATAISTNPTVTKINMGTLVKVVEAGHAIEGETGSIESYIGGGYYLVRFDSVGVIKLSGLALDAVKGA